MHTVKELANVYQGIARAGHGVGAHSGEWMLRIVESGDVRDDGWLDLTGLNEIGTHSWTSVLNATCCGPSTCW